MDLSYKFPSEDNALRRESIPYLPQQETLVSKFQQNQFSSPLLQLPAELRLKIWQHTLGGNRLLPPGIIRCNDVFYPCPANIYLFAEPLENMRYFLSLLCVSRQIYHEARLFPFSCNIWEFWMSGMSDRSYFRDPWVDWPRGVTIEQLEAIEWILIGARRRVVEGVQERSRQEVDWGMIERMKGLKVIIRKVPIHWGDGEVIGECARRMGCKVVEEEMVELMGVYNTVPLRRRDY